MKKKFLTFLFAICLIFPCAFIMTACGGNGNNPPEDNTPYQNGYNVYINGTNNNYFECTWGDEAITADDITIKSDWTDKSKNTVVPISEFEISVVWSNEYNQEQTTLPDFWTNATGDTSNSFATTYTFTLTKGEFSTIFDVYIRPITAQDCRVRIFDGNEYTYSAEMEWCYNDRESDTSKHFSFDIENLDPEYSMQEHMQWCYVEKEAYDALSTKAQKKEFVMNSNFSTSQMNNYFAPGTYYIFAFVPSCNNIQYGEDGNGYIYDYATLTILPIEFQQEEVENRILQHDDSQYKDDYTYSQLGLNDEIKNMEEVYINCNPYVFENGSWKEIELAYNTPIKVHAVWKNNEYKLVELKDHTSNSTEWVFVNEDGTQGDAVTNNSEIQLVNYSAVSNYKNNTSATFSIYYKVADMSSFGKYYDYTKVFKSTVKIRKYLNIIVPIIDTEHGGEMANKYVTDLNTFEFTYGDRYELTWATTLNSPEEIMQNIIGYSSHFNFVDFDQTEYSTEPYYGYLTLDSHNYAWKLDGTNYTSEPLKITYYINKKAKIEKPVYINAESSTDYFANPIEVVWDSNLYTYSLGEYITIGDINSEANYDNSWINVYSYLLTNEDLSLSHTALIEKVRQQGTNIGLGNYFTSEENNTPGNTFVIMYDLSNKTSIVWENESTSPILFKFTIIKADQTVKFVDETDSVLNSKSELNENFNVDGTIDFKQHIFVNEEYSSEIDTQLVFERVESIEIESSTVTTSIVGELTDGVLSIDLNSESNPFGDTSTYVLKVTRKGETYYNDYVIYLVVKMSKFSVATILDDNYYIADNVESSILYDSYYESFELYNETKFSELNMANLPETEWGTFTWCHVANDQFVSECKADDILDNGYIAICFTPVNSNLKWILEENEEFNIIASFQVKYYPI